MTDRYTLTLDYLNNLDKIKVLKQKYDDNIITGKEIIELINLHRSNKKIRKKIRKLLDREWLMTFEEVKKWLNRAYKIDELIKLDKKKLEELEELSTAIGGFTTDERVQTSTNTSTPFVEKILKKDDAIKKYNERIIERYNIKEEIDEVINSISDNEVIQVLDYRYLQFVQWRDIARLMCISTGKALSLHRKGLEMVSKKINTKWTLKCYIIVL